MRYGVISDVHSNLEALDAVLDFLASKNIGSYLCCGDIIGYGPNPNECINKVKNLKNVKMVLGNHDAAVCGLKELKWFNEYAQAAIFWTKERLSGENCSFLRSLPQIYTESNFTIVHGSPRNPLSEYLMTRMQFSENIPLFNTQICFVGHSHVPLVYQYDTNTSSGAFQTVSGGFSLKIEPGYKYIINVGGVGQPRDSDVRAACVIYDSDSPEAVFSRVEYDYRKTQKKMEELNLPEFLIERLQRGS